MTIATVYESAGTDWIVYNEITDTKLRFNTEEEAVRMTDKLNYANSAQASSTIFAQMAADMAELVSTYFDRGYNSGGVNEITDVDLASLNIDASDLSDFITLAQQMANFIGNVAVITGDYGATANKMRTDI